MNNILNGADDVMKEFEEEIKIANEADESSSEEVLEEVEKNQEPAEEVEEVPAEEEEPEEEQEEDVTPTGKAFAKMRYENKQKEKALKTMGDEVQQLKERLAKQEGFAEALKKPVEEVAEEPEPDKEYDRERWLEWKVNQQDKVLQSLNEGLTKTTEANRSHAEEKAVGILETDYRTKNPAYEEAAKFVTERELKIMKAMAPNMSDAQLQRKFHSEKTKLFRDIYDNSAGKTNPCDVIMRMADAYGWKKTEAAPKNPKGPNITNLKNNQRKNSSLIGGARGSNATPEVTAEAVFTGALNDLAFKTPDFFDKAIKSAQDY